MNNLAEWFDINGKEIGEIRDFLRSMQDNKDNPVARREMMCKAPAYFDRASSLAAQANGIHRVALSLNWPESGSAEKRKRETESASHHEEVMRDSLKGLVKALDHLIEISRTLSSDDRAAIRSTGVAAG